MTFSVIYHSLIRTWTLTLSKVHVVSEASLTSLSVYLLLVGQSLFELKLLLQFLLFVSQNRVLTWILLKRVGHIHYISLLFYR